MEKKQFILQEIRRVANEVSPNRLTSREFFQRTSVSHGSLRYWFETWNKAVKEAGLKPTPPGPPKQKRLPDEDLLAEIGVLWRRFRKRPTESMMNSSGKYSVKPYKKRWRTFSAAVDKFVAEHGVPGIDDEGATNGAAGTIPVLLIPKTHKPSKKSASKPPTMVGEPLDFRGLRYAPLNEQGVVYFFGMVSRELGFVIESVRTAFPDCEGKRRLSPKGDKWQHVKIEFEFRSSNFSDHGHDPDECDLIVCWEHNWKDCPVEVLELKSVVEQLPKN